MGKVSLTEFADKHPRYRRESWITTLPEWPAILEAWQTGTVNSTQIREWLVRECGYPADQVTYSRTGGYLSKEYPRNRRG